MYQRRSLWLLAIAMLSACSGGDPTGPAKVASITVQSGTTTVRATRKEKLNAEAKDDKGVFIPGKSFVWTSSNESVATVATDGLLTAVSPGTATVTAASEGKVGQIVIAVTPAPLATISISYNPAQLRIGQLAIPQISVVDSAGKAVTDTQLSWSSTDPTVVRVDANGAVTALSVGSSRIDARADGILGSATITVTATSVATVTVSLNPANVLVGESAQASATLRDAQGNTITGRSVSWSSSDQSVATINGSGVISALKVGTTTITGSVDGKSGSAQFAVNATQSSCSTNQLSTFAVGEVRTLSSAQKSFFCIGAGGTSADYVVIPFFNLPVASSVVNLRIAGTNTLAPAASMTIADKSLLPVDEKKLVYTSDVEFLLREQKELGHLFASRRALQPKFTRELAPSLITGVPSSPSVGAVYRLNANLSGSLCDPKDLHGARVVSVLPHVIIMVDTLAPAGGYTNAELTAFGQAFEANGYALDTLNFGSPVDIDGNGKVLVFFTPGVNRLPAPPGGVVGGLQTNRDLYPVIDCAGSNEGEMFYMPVPDPNKTINGNYSDKASVSSGVLATLVHEFQHLINAERRAFVNNATVLEDVWLNEGLSHVAEELLFYQSAGRSPKQNIGLSTVQSSQTVSNAFLTYQLQNIGRLFTYMQAAESNSPFAQNDNLETRGAIWQLLRYAADRKGGNQPAIWRSLVNTTVAGQANFNNVFGNIVTMTRDWAVAQFADDQGIPVASNYMNPSWDFRTLMPVLNNGTFPLLTRTLSVSPLSVTLSGGAASYVRFQVSSAATASLNLTTSGQPLPPEVDVMVMRTR